MNPDQGITNSNVNDPQGANPVQMAPEQIGSPLVQAPAINQAQSINSLNIGPDSETKSFLNKKLILIFLIAIVLIMAIIGVVGALLWYRNNQNSSGANLNEWKPASTTPSAGFGDLSNSNDSAKSETKDGPAAKNDSELQAMNEKFGKVLGAMPPPDPSTFVKTFDYRGVTIKYSRKLSLSEEKLALLKFAIDRMPQEYIINKPWAILVIDSTEFPDKNSEMFAATHNAFASGPYFYIPETAAAGANIVLNTDNDAFVQTVLHEWMHIIQYFKIYKELSVADIEKDKGYGARVMMYRTPFAKSFSDVAGWYFSDPQYLLKTDAESQKTTDYGKTDPNEDLADTAANFLTGNTDVLSQGRIQWMEKFSGKSASFYQQGMIGAPTFAKQSRIDGGSDRLFSTVVFNSYRAKFAIVNKRLYGLDRGVSPSATVSHFKAELPKRGFALVSSKPRNKSADNIPGTVMEFQSSKSSAYLEILDFPNATGYRTKPDGAILTMIVGINL